MIDISQFYRTVRVLLVLYSTELLLSLYHGRGEIWPQNARPRLTVP